MAASNGLSEPEKLARLRLIRSENVGPITFHKLMERFGTGTRALEALPELARRGGMGRKIKIAAKADIDRELDALAKAGAQLVGLDEPDYPPLLAQIEDAPPFLSVIGHRHLLQKRAVGVVGSRNASLNGLRFTETISRDMGQNGLLVVSGMARGIDANAHVGSLETGTVAVLGGGVDVIYPKENAELYHAIAEQGAIVSEMIVGTVPQARHFPRRNRLISGMSRGVLVIEATARSGTLITARFALEQGREVFAIPGWPTDPRSEGTNGLIRDGAILTRSAKDVFSVFDEMLNRAITEPERPDYKGVLPVPPDEADLPPARKAIGIILGPSPVSVDEIIRQCQLSAAVVSTVLLEMELSGRLDRHPGNKVSRAD